jgi:hypothetical protein
VSRLGSQAALSGSAGEGGEAQRLMSYQQRRITMANRKLILGSTILLIASVVALRSTSTAAPPAERKRVAFLDRLKVGQAVALTDKDGRYEIGVFPPELHPATQSSRTLRNTSSSAMSAKSRTRSSRSTRLSRSRSCEYQVSDERTDVLRL